MLIVKEVRLYLKKYLKSLLGRIFYREGDLRLTPNNSSLANYGAKSKRTGAVVLFLLRRNLRIGTFFLDYPRRRPTIVCSLLTLVSP